MELHEQKSAPARESPWKLTQSAEYTSAASCAIPPGQTWSVAGR